jgi:hypothetical protein
MRSFFNLGLLKKGLLLAGGALGIGMFAYSLAQQTLIQGQMNHTMTVIDSSLAKTGTVVAATSTTLQPLVDTTRALAQIETAEEHAADSLASMNNHLAQTAEGEKKIIAGLGSLNEVTSGVGGQLADLGQVTGNLLQAGADSKTQAAQIADGVAALNGMTDTSIAELKRLNDKLAALRLLP